MMKAAIAVLTVLIPIGQGLKCNFGIEGETKVCEPGEQCYRILYKSGTGLLGAGESCSNTHTNKCPTDTECRLYMDKDDRAICCCNSDLCNNEHYEPVEARSLLNPPPTSPPTLGPPPPGGGFKCYTNEDSEEMQYCKNYNQCFRTMSRKHREDGFKGRMRGCQGTKQQCATGKECQIDEDDNDFVTCCCDSELCNNDSYEPTEIKTLLPPRSSLAIKSTIANFWCIIAFTAIVTHWVHGHTG